MATNLHTHQTLEERHFRWVEEKHQDDNYQKHESAGVLEVVI